MVCGPISAALAYCFIFIFLDILVNFTRTLWYDQFARGFKAPHNTAKKSEHFYSTVWYPKLIALHASAPNHVFGQ